MPGNLVLSRRVGETLTYEVPPSALPQIIVVEVVEIDARSKVRLASKAEPEVKIYRTEILGRRSA